MTKTLFVEGGRPRLMAPTTTTKLARRMLRAAQIVAEHLPPGIGNSPALDILLSLYVAEEEARYLSIGELTPANDPSPAVIERWIAYLVQLELIERRDDMLALTTVGYTAMTDVVEALFVAQRALD